MKCVPLYFWHPWPSCLPSCSSKIPPKQPFIKFLLYCTPTVFQNNEIEIRDPIETNTISEQHGNPNYPCDKITWADHRKSGAARLFTNKIWESCGKSNCIQTPRVGHMPANQSIDNKTINFPSSIARGSFDFFFSACAFKDIRIYRHGHCQLINIYLSLKSSISCVGIGWEVRPSLSLPTFVFLPALPAASGMKGAAFLQLRAQGLFGRKAMVQDLP